MSGRDAPAGDPSSSEGSLTAEEGTPVSVDITGDLRARATVAMFLAGPVILSVHFMVVYLAVEAGCTGDGPGLRVFDPPAPTIVTLAATAVAAIASLVAAGWGYRRWHRSGHQSEAGSSSGLEPADPGGSLAFASFLMSLLSLVTVLFVGLPALVLPSC